MYISQLLTVHSTIYIYIYIYVYKMVYILILVNYNKNSDKGMQHILLQDLAIGKVTSEDSGNLFYF